MFLLIPKLSTVYTIYRSAVNIIAYRYTAIRKAAITVNTEYIRACREMSVTPRPITLGFTNAPGSMSV